MPNPVLQMPNPVTSTRNLPIEIRALQRSDAESLVECFRRCYAGSYVAEVFNDAALAAQTIETGELRSVVAVDASDVVVGHMGLSPRKGALTAEMGNTVVDPACRGQNVAARMSAELARQCVELGLVAFVHYPTTAHAVMQKLAAKGEGVEVGVLLDYIPGETRYVGFEDVREGRVAVVAFHHTLAEGPLRRVFVPAAERELARAIYASARLPRELLDATAPLPATPSTLTARFESRRGLQRIEVAAAGSDLVARVARETQLHPQAPVMLDLALADPAVGAAAAALRSVGFFFGAVLPEYLPSGDALRLQRIDREPVEPLLESERARELYAHSVRDRAPAAR